MSAAMSSSSSIRVMGVGLRGVASPLRILGSILQFVFGVWILWAAHAWFDSGYRSYVKLRSFGRNYRFFT